MNKFTIQFRKTPDEMPKDGESVFYVDYSEFNRSFDIRWGRAEYSWFDPEEPGEQCFEEEPGWTKRLMFGNEVMDDGLLWCRASDVEAMLP